MKAFVYQLFHVGLRDTDGQVDTEVGFFTSLPSVREYIKNSFAGPEDFDCYRHPFNPKVFYVPEKVDIFPRKKK